LALTGDIPGVLAGCALFFWSVDLYHRKRVTAEADVLVLPRLFGARRIDWSAIASIDVDERKPYRIVVVAVYGGQTRRLVHDLGPSLRQRRARNFEDTRGIVDQVRAIRDERAGEHPAG
jgi:hypothetical protein